MVDIILLQNDQEDTDYHDEDQVPQNATLQYKHLIAMNAKKRTGGIKEWFKLDPDKVQRISLGEEKFGKAVLTHGTDIVRCKIYTYAIVASYC